MKLQNTSGEQDSILTDCLDFGGKAAEAVEIVEELDQRLTEALNEIDEFKKQQT